MLLQKFILVRLMLFLRIVPGARLPSILGQQPPHHHNYNGPKVMFLLFWLFFLLSDLEIVS